MRKALMLALGLGVASANAGLESLTNDVRTVNSDISGTIDVPFTMSRDLIEKEILMGKLAKVVGSPYNVFVDSDGKIAFCDKGNTNRLEYVENTATTNYFVKKVGMTGNRGSTKISVFLVLEGREKADKTEYDSRMYTLLDSGLKRWVAKKVRNYEWGRKFTEKYFENEQRVVAEVLNNLASEWRRNPREFMNTINTGTNGIAFDPQEKVYVSESLRKYGFLK